MSKIKYGALNAFKQFITSMRDRGVRYIFHGTQEEWDALTDAEKGRYDEAQINDAGNVYTSGKVYTSSAVSKSSVAAPTSIEVATLTIPEDGTYLCSATVYITHNDSASQHYMRLGIGLAATEQKGIEQKYTPTTGLWFNVSCILSLRKGRILTLYSDGNAGTQLCSYSGSFDVIKVAPVD